MTIIYSCDENFVPQAATNAVSLLRYNAGANIIVMGFGVSAPSVEKLRTAVVNGGGDFRFVDASDRVKMLGVLGVPEYVSFATYTRLFIAELLPDITGRIIYIDCDTLVVDALNELEAFDLQGKVCAAGPDTTPKSFLPVIGISKDAEYHNTGILLIDLDAWRAAKCTQRCVEEMRHPSAPIVFADQDVIARVLANEITTYPRRWNFLSPYVLLRVKEQPAIYHFAGHTLGRPWYTSSRHPMRKEYVRVATQAGFAAAANQKRPMLLSYRIEYYFYRVLPLFLFRPVYYLLHRLHVLMVYHI